MAYNLSDEMLQQFQNYRRAKTKHDVRTVAAAVGGGIRAMRTGESARDAIQQRLPSYEGTYMTDQEKLEKYKELGLQLQEDEQFYADIDHKERVARYKERQANWRKVVDAETRKLGHVTDAATARARLQALHLQKELDVMQEQENQLIEPNERSRADVAGLVEATRAQMESAVAKKYNTLVVSAGGAPEGTEGTEATRRGGFSLTGDTGDGGRTLSSAEKQDIRRQAEREVMVDGGKQAVIEGILAIERAHGEAGATQDPIAMSQMRSAMQMYAEEMGVDLQEIKSGESDAARAISRADDQAQWALDTYDRDTAQRHAEIVQKAGQTFGDSTALDAVTASNQAIANTTMRSFQAPRPSAGMGSAEGGVTPRMQVEDLDDSGRNPYSDTAYRPPEEGDPMESFDYDGGETLLGLPIKPASTAQARTEQLLDLIERFPNAPPLQRMRDQLIKNPQFARYKADRGYDGMDDAKVFKEMSREARVKSREKNKEFKKQRRHNIDTGVAPGRGPFPRQPKPAERPQSTPVHGQDRSTASPEER